jgi:3-oxoacyl-[acyl-carrier protein] reductase
MDFNITGRAAFVSGGSKGVGRAVARFLAKEGCRVVVDARGQEGIDEAVAEIRDLGGTATGVSVDLADAAR